jgi:hypothetical protein
MGNTKLKNWVNEHVSVIDANNLVTGSLIALTWNQLSFSINFVSTVRDLDILSEFVIKANQAKSSNMGTTSGKKLRPKVSS